MKALIAVFIMRWREETQYRGAVLGGVFCQVFFGLILVAVYRALYDSRPQTLPLQDVVTYVWLQQAFFRMLLSSDSELATKIRTGEFAYDLCRPISVYGYYFMRRMAQKMVGSLMRCIPMIAIALLLPNGWNLRLPVSSLHLVCALTSLGAGLLCVCAVDGIATGFTVRTLDNKGVEAMINLGMLTFCGNLLPLTLFPDSWQTVIRLLPFAQLLDAPIRLYTGTQDLKGLPLLLALQLLWTLVLTGAGLWLWRSNQKRIVVQGG